MAKASVVTSTLTDRIQTTVPAMVRKAQLIETIEQR